jgi:hypothetical protein
LQHCYLGFLFSSKQFHFLFFIFTGAYHNKTDLNGRVLTDHMLFGTIVATTLVIVVTAQVNFESGFFKFIDTKRPQKFQNIALFGFDRVEQLINSDLF